MSDPLLPPGGHEAGPAAYREGADFPPRRPCPTCGRTVADRLRDLAAGYDAVADGFGTEAAIQRQTAGQWHRDGRVLAAAEMRRSAAWQSAYEEEARVQAVQLRIRAEDEEAEGRDDGTR